MLGWRQAFMKATSLLKLASWPGDTSMLAFSFLTATSNVVSSTALYTWRTRQQALEMHMHTNGRQLLGHGNLSLARSIFEISQSRCPAMDALEHAVLERSAGPCRRSVQAQLRTVPKLPLPSFHSLPPGRWQTAMRSGLMDQSRSKKVLANDDLGMREMFRAA